MNRRTRSERREDKIRDRAKKRISALSDMEALIWVENSGSDAVHHLDLWRRTRDVNHLLTAAQRVSAMAGGLDVLLDRPRD